MNYTEFNEALLQAMASAADANPRGQVNVFPVADGILPDVRDQWVSDAVTGYESDDLVFNVSRGLGNPRGGHGGIVLMLTGKGREKAQYLKEKYSRKLTIEAEQAESINIISG